MWGYDNLQTATCTGTTNFYLLAIPLGLLMPVLGLIMPMLPVALSVTGPCAVNGMTLTVNAAAGACVLTAKTSGRAAALHAIAHLRAHNPALALRDLELRAKEKACEHPDRTCHGQSCPLAKGFYDRLPAARTQATQAPNWHHETVRTIALAHQVCPYHLSQELVRWSDVVVGDYVTIGPNSAVCGRATIGAD